MQYGLTGAELKAALVAKLAINKGDGEVRDWVGSSYGGIKDQHCLWQLSLHHHLWWSCGLLVVSS